LHLSRQRERKELNNTIDTIGDNDHSISFNIDEIEQQLTEKIEFGYEMDSEMNDTSCHVTPNPHFLKFLNKKKLNEFTLNGLKDIDIKTMDIDNIINLYECKLCVQELDESQLKKNNSFQLNSNSDINNNNNLNNSHKLEKMNSAKSGLFKKTKSAGSKKSLLEESGKKNMKSER
jgi:hypothetical protein